MTLTAMAKSKILVSAKSSCEVASVLRIQADASPRLTVKRSKPLNTHSGRPKLDRSFGIEFASSGGSVTGLGKGFLRACRGLIRCQSD
jgi:hypothetical protein